MDLIRLFYQPWTRRVTRRVLVGRLRARDAPERGRFTRVDVDGFLLAAWDDYSGNDFRVLPAEPADADPS
ncbi:hypothetical protein BH09MYX1_BH09MYX1_29210 [soil metagenome]